MSKLHPFQCINLVFFTSFQFINLSNLALWVNNKHKWITVIFLNLCDNLLYYMICFCLLSLVFVSLLLFISLSWSCLHIFDTHPLPLPTLQICYGLPPKTFPNFTIFSSIACPCYCPTTSQQTIKHYTDIFSLSYLYNIRERVTNTESQSQKAQKIKIKIKNHRHKFNS